MNSRNSNSLIFPRSKIEPPEPGSTSVRFGPAYLVPSIEERGHYKLMRPIITVKNTGDKTTTEQHSEPIPIAVYRLKRKGDNMILKSEWIGPPLEMKTSDPKTGAPMDLVLVWWPGKDA